MDYFYSPPKNITNDIVIIDDDEFNHLVHVMRKKEGDTVRIVDGVGNAYDVTLLTLKKKTAIGKIYNTYSKHNEPTIEVSLAAGVLKNPSRFDFLVEKATELGVKEIIPLKTERTIPSHAKTERWQKLALAAMKQSCRSYLPLVHPLTPLSSVLHACSTYKIVLIAHKNDEQTTVPIRNSISDGRVLLLVGPEGGFSDEEFAHARVAGCIPLSLGIRRLRTETAAIVALSLVMNELEPLNTAVSSH
jgi:16S rRNA (uracil1498-N3)-methyltransferase